MKYNILLALILFVGITSCRKAISPQPAASLNVINVAVNAGSVKVNSFGESVIYASFPSLNYGSNAVYTMGAGTRRVTIVPSADTLHPIFSKDISVKSNGIYSLYLAGQSPTYDTVLLEDNIPYRTDSSIGVRFINLSVNSTPMTITQSTTPTLTEFQNISYKQITDYKTYPALIANKTYVFQIRDAANTVRATYTLTPPRFFNVTLVIKGLMGTTSGTNAFGVQRVNNY